MRTINKRKVVELVLFLIIINFNVCLKTQNQSFILRRRLRRHVNRNGIGYIATESALKDGHYHFSVPSLTKVHGDNMRTKMGQKNCS